MSVKKLTRVLLIDDDEATNFLHRRAIERSGCQVEVTTAANGRLALDQLSVELATGVAAPTIILVDVHMDVLDGWGFVEGFAHIPRPWRQATQVYMVTNSLDPVVLSRCEEHDLITEVLDKSEITKLLGPLLEAVDAKSSRSQVSG